MNYLSGFPFTSPIAVNIIVRCVTIALSVCLPYNLHSQSLTAEETIAGYNNAQKRILVLSTAVFTDMLTQGKLESDSAMIIAFQLTGLPFLIGYSDDDASVPASPGARLINEGKIREATRLIKNISAGEQLQLSIELATWYLHRNGANKKILIALINIFKMG